MSQPDPENLIAMALYWTCQIPDRGMPKDLTPADAALIAYTVGCNARKVTGKVRCSEQQWGRDVEGQVEDTSGG
jgi:hypothetical protein